MPKHESLKNIILEKQAVIFDLYNTLTSLESTGFAVPRTSGILGVSQEKWDEQLLEKSKDRLTGKIKDPCIFVRQMARGIDPGISDELIQRAIQNRNRRFRGALVNIPNSTKQTLVKLKKIGKKIGLLSNADTSEMAGWKESPIASLFDSVVFSCEVGFAKPEREIYEISLKQLSASPQGAMFIGDGGSRELEGAKKLGIVTVFIAGLIRELLPDKIEARQKLADFTIENLNELIS
jgi:putative hydrolase of the HAD superfamily